MNASHSSPVMLMDSCRNGTHAAADMRHSDLVIENLTELAAAGVVSYTGSCIADFASESAPALSA